YRGSQRRTRTAQTEARILEAPRQGPTNGTTHWSSYRLAKELGISQSSVSRVWRHFGIQPHRVRGYMASDDPEVEEKAASSLACILSRRSRLQCSMSTRERTRDRCRIPILNANDLIFQTVEDGSRRRIQEITSPQSQSTNLLCNQA